MKELVVLLVLVVGASWGVVSPNNTSLRNKVMMGYQGWFATEGDGADLGWMHWSRTGGTPSGTDAAFDLFPVLDEYPASCLTDTGMVDGEGNPVGLFSAQCAGVVDIHFAWMQAYGLDGVFLQRFVNELAPGSRTLQARDVVLRNVLSAAEATGRVFSIMYDISGSEEEWMLQRIQDDWWRLERELNITSSPSYLTEGGKPVVAVWGLGFTDRPGNFSTAYNTINWFQINGAFVLGGVPFEWRTGTGDSKSGFDEIYAKFDALSPWSVGRYNSPAGYESTRTAVQVPDVQLTKSRGQMYAPVVWPGFSWANLQQDPVLFNDIPRLGGEFYDTQLQGGYTLKPDMLYVAMFDEVNESTAIFKCANDTASTPTSGQWLTLDNTPEDFYLQLTGQITQKFHSRASNPPTGD